MLFGYLTLATALIISLSAAVYSSLGLTAIFAAAFWPIVIMGGSLEFGKIITTLWLHKYWDRAEIQYKVYLCSAVAILMLLTSMGVFGFLSKAHTDQGLVSGDVGAKIAVYDEKIKIEKDNIDANRKALQQMDAAVDQVMGRSTDEKGADKAVAIRRSQAKERSRLLAEIADSQKKVTTLNEERAPIAAENRKVEAEVGPIKYIAALVYGDNPDANVLEKSVRWVIILIVIVFDPLALTLLLAATKSLEWERGIDIFNSKKREDETPFDDWTDEDFAALEKDLINDITPENVHPDQDYQQFKDYYDNHPAVVKKPRWSGFSMPFGSMFHKKEEPEQPVEDLVIDDNNDERPGDYLTKDDLEELAMKEARRRWKEDNPNDTLHRQEDLFNAGAIKTLPWFDPKYYVGLTADNSPSGPTGEVKGFGTTFPKDASKGDMYLRVDQMPSMLYKFNGRNWIEVDKGLTDQHAYDEAYIDHLISKIESGEYDPELLSNAERDAIEKRLG
jgi:hypothetical protein